MFNGKIHYKWSFYVIFNSYFDITRGYVSALGAKSIKGTVASSLRTSWRDPGRKNSSDLILCISYAKKKNDRPDRH